MLRSQVACAVLGLVIEKPSHGYEIGQRFDRRFGGFLSVGRSSIYAALASLMDAGLIEKMAGRSTTGVSRGAKAGASYRATAPGARAYREWLAERVRNDPAACGDAGTDDARGGAQRRGGTRLHRSL